MCSDTLSGGMFLFSSNDVLYQLALFNYCSISFYFIGILYPHYFAWTCSWSFRSFFIFRIYVIQMETSFQQKSQKRHIFNHFTAYDQLEVRRYYVIWLWRHNSVGTWKRWPLEEQIMLKDQIFIKQVKLLLKGWLLNGINLIPMVLTQFMRRQSWNA